MAPPRSLPGWRAGVAAEILRPVQPQLRRDLVSVAVLAGIVAWLLPLRPQVTGAVFFTSLLVGAAFVVAGALAARLRPDTRTWWLLLLVGALHTISVGTAETFVPWRYTLGLGLEDAWIPVLAYLALVHPGSRLRGAANRAVVGGLAVVCLGAIPFELAWSPPAADCLSCPPAGNVLFQTQAPFNFLDALDVHRDVRTALIGLTLLALAIRFLRASTPLRRQVWPVLLATTALAAKEVADELWIAQQVVFESDRPDLVTVPNALLTAAIPVAFVVGALRTRVDRGALTGLVTGLRELPPGGDVRELLARALRDPLLDVGYWAPSLNGYVARDGSPFDVPGPDDQRAVTEVGGDAGPLAVLVHDPALSHDAGYLEAVGATAQLALENERLKAEVRARLEQVSQSRARIVEASDAERRRIERDLHDGAQQRLVSLSLAVTLTRSAIRRGAGPDEIGGLLDRIDGQAHAALDELRDLARGIHPTILTEAGLGPALRAVAERAPLPVEVGGVPDRRLPAAVEVAAYFVCCEAIANAAKHAGADSVRIEAEMSADGLELSVVDDGRGGASLNGGTGLRGLADRVEALGGRLEVRSTPGSGSTIAAIIPLVG